jgi:hypothetical protein
VISDFWHRSLSEFGFVGFFRFIGFLKSQKSVNLTNPNSDRDAQTITINSFQRITTFGMSFLFNKNRYFSRRIDNFTLRIYQIFSLLKTHISKLKTHENNERSLWAIY